MLVYRTEIDGLRTIAVVPVALYHAGFYTLLAGVPATNHDNLIVYFLRKRRQYRCNALLLSVYRYTKMRGLLQMSAQTAFGRLRYQLQITIV